MQRLLSFVLSLFSFVPMVHAAADTAIKYATYENTQKGYSIQYPSNWTKEEVEGFDLFLVSPEDPVSKFHLNASVIAGPIPDSVSQDLYYTENLKNLLDSTSGMIITDNCKSTISSVKTNWIQYTRDDNPKIKISQYLFAAKQLGFVITLGTAESDFEKYKDTFNQIANSFKLIEKKPVEKSS